MNALLVGKREEDGQFHVYHMALYPETPTQVDIDDLRRELSETPEFGLMDRISEMEIRATVLRPEAGQPPPENKESEKCGT
jgi:hypothetical protein